MEPDPLKAEPPKRKHRRFQFRLRTLMIGVTLLAAACWVAVDRGRLIRDRDNAIQKEPESSLVIIVGNLREILKMVA
jgi:hypothetical protein